MMKIVFLSLFLLGMISRGYGLDCYSCEITVVGSYDGEGASTDNCYNNVAGLAGMTGSTSPETCSTDSPTNKFYCRTIFTILDGVTSGVKRECVGSTADIDEHSDAVPTSDKCVTTFDPSGQAGVKTQTLCYLHCATDNCNTDTAASLKQCTSNCNNGDCNYITGICDCNTGYSGEDCQTEVASTAVRQCVQCTSETDSGCSSSSTSSDCPANQAYCSSTTTTIIDSTGSIISSIITKGCTADFKAVDECIFNEVIPDDPINTVGYKEINCFSTCNTDGCNTNSADGIINGNEAIGLQCVVCSDPTGSGKCNPGEDDVKKRQACPSESTHCKSTVTYVISEKADLAYLDGNPAFNLLTVERECATSAVTAECTESTIGSLGVKKVTCTETCQGDGCNNGWPARPECVTCSTGDGIPETSYDENEYDHCLKNPPMAKTCLLPYHAFCYIRETGFEKGTRDSVEGYPRRINRGCSFLDLGTGCSTSSPRDAEIETCNRTCSTDGCNAGSGGSMLIATLLTFILPATFGWLTQRYF